MSRIAERFAALAAEGRAGFIPFIMAGDPDFATSQSILDGLPSSGADLIELGVCFTDPMADGPAIQAAGLRALKSGQTLSKTLQMVRSFRLRDDVTPLILMGYYNPFYSYGVERFLVDAREAGVDGLILVDLPPEEDAEFCIPARAAGVDFVRLATPTTDAARMPTVLRHASGFVYYVSVAGVTGSGSGARAAVDEAVARLKRASGLPVAVGFGIKTAEQATETGRVADAVVVGSALVERLSAALPAGPREDGLELGASEADIVINAVLSAARDLGRAIRSARK